MQMALSSFVISSLKQEAYGLRIRLEQVKPFAMVMPAVPAAGISSGAFIAIERYMDRGRHEIGKSVDTYLHWLQGPDAKKSSPVEAQRRLCFLRMKFNAVLTQFDIFADVLTQRSEHDYGVWLSGLDQLAADALTLKGEYFKKPYVATYLDRGFGAAIRRARTRLPGGGKNPVAIIRIPRERMVGSGIASSLVHEVGHQGSALLDLVNSMRGHVQQVQHQHDGDQRMAWTIWERWLSEIIADFWAVAKLGVTATQGLMGVVSLPRAFVFRMNLDDPHPFPWIRVKLSASMGNALFPHPQWQKLGQMWEDFYPRKGLSAHHLKIISLMEETMPRFIELFLRHRPGLLRGKSLPEVFPLKDRQPARLRTYYESWGFSPEKMYVAPPALVFAVIGQARMDGKINPEAEAGMLSTMLTYWAVQRISGRPEALCGRRMPELFEWERSDIKYSR